MTPLMIPFRDRVLRSRREFLHDLATLPPPLNSITRTHYMNRVERSRSKTLLGEFAPWLFADLAGVTDERAMARFTRPWLSIYAYILFVDDILDRCDIADREYLTVAAGILLERGLSEFHGLSREHKGEDLILVAHRLLRDTAAAACQELGRRHDWTWTTRGIRAEQIGDKVAILKLCLAYARTLTPQNRVRRTDWRAVGMIGAGLQILDDITDWEEDWRSRHYTYPLALALTALKAKKIVAEADVYCLSTDQVLAAMVFTGVLERCLTESKSLLLKSLTSLQAKPGSAGAIYIDKTTRNIDHMAERVREARIALDKWRRQRRDKDWFLQISTEAEVLQVLDSVRKRFPIVAQSS